MRATIPTLLGVLLFASAAGANDLEAMQTDLTLDLSRQIESQASRAVAERSRDVAFPLLWQAASMQCVDHAPDAAECRVVLVVPKTHVARVPSPPNP